MLEQKNDNNTIQNQEKKIWKTFDIIRGELPPSDYYIICLFLVLKKEGLLKNISSEEPYFIKNDFFHTIRNRIGKKKKYSSLNEIIEVFEPIISSLSEIAIKSLIDSINSLDKKKLSQYILFYFESVLFKISQIEGRKSGQFYQPIELTRLIYSLANVKEGQMIYNPFGAEASFASFIQSNVIYIGEDLNEKSWAIGKLRLMVYGKEEGNIYLNNDSINNWNKYGYQYDQIFITPPLGMRLAHYISGQFGPIKTVEQFLIEKGIESLKDTGKLIAIIPMGFLFKSGAEQSLRRYLVENDLIETVISFPGGIFMTSGISIAILVINKTKSQKGFIRFVDAKSFVFVDPTFTRQRRIKDKALYKILNSQRESEFVKSVSIDTIREFDFNLNAPLYFQKKIEGIIFSEIVSFVRGIRPRSVVKGKFIRIRDLNGDSINYRLNTNSVENVLIPNPALKISESVLLVASRWKTLKPTYFEYKGDPIYIYQDIIALSPDFKKVDLLYLIHELNSEYIGQQLDIYRTGSIIPNIRRQDLMELKIILPSLEQQKFKVKGFTEAILSEKKKELDLLAKIHGLENLLHQENSFLRHSIAGPLKNVRSAFSSIKSIMDNKIIHNIPDLINLKENDLSNLTLGKYMEILERDISIISENTRRNGTVSEINLDKQMTPINIISFLKDYVGEIENRSETDFDIGFTFDKEAFKDEEGNTMEIFILGNEGLLKDLVDNLIENAVLHAFKRSSSKNFDIFLMYDEADVNEITVLFSNSGEGFPPGYTLEMFTTNGSKAGENSGDGFGGWYINEIIKKHGGQLDIIDEQGPEGLLDTDLATSFEIKLPIFSN